MVAQEINLGPATLHMRGRSGSHFAVTLFFKQNNAPMDLTGKLFVFQVFSQTGIKMLELRNGNGITVPPQDGEEKGYVYITITAQKMAEINPGRYRYEFEGEPMGNPGARRAYLEGEFVVSKEWGT